MEPLPSSVILGVALAAIVVVAWWLRGRSYRIVFRIPVRRDDSFVCRGDAGTTSVRLEPDGLDLPAGLDARGQTALLTLDVSATPVGRLADPFIDVRQGEVSYRQVLERGAAGRRHLNLSPLFQRGGAASGRVQLRGGLVRWRREAKLTLFDPPPIEGAGLLVLAPHPDDAEIAAFGLYSSGRSWVATITGGDRGMADLTAVVPRAEGSRWSADLRVWDSLTIPQLGGVPRERCLNLVYPDGQLREMYRQPNRPAWLACEPSLPRAALRARNGRPEFQGGEPGCTWAGLVDELRRLLEIADPDIVVCPHPLVDGHSDHVFTAVALAEAARQLPDRNRLFLLYVVHRRDVPVYPFGAAETLVSLPPWTEEEWLADGLYSHPLGLEGRRAKYFAVEATHDLRTFQAGAPRTVRQVATAVKRELSALFGGTGLPAATFLRRAPRPNELYYVVSAQSLSELVTRALARQSAVP